MKFEIFYWSYGDTAPFDKIAAFLIECGGGYLSGDSGEDGYTVIASNFPVRTDQQFNDLLNFYAM